MGSRTHRDSATAAEIASDLMDGKIAIDESCVPVTVIPRNVPTTINAATTTVRHAVAVIGTSR